MDVECFYDVRSNTPTVHVADRWEGDYGRALCGAYIGPDGVATKTINLGWYVDEAANADPYFNRCLFCQDELKEEATQTIIETIRSHLMSRAGSRG